MEGKDNKKKVDKNSNNKILRVLYILPQVIYQFVNWYQLGFGIEH